MTAQMDDERAALRQQMQECTVQLETQRKNVESIEKRESAFEREWMTVRKAQSEADGDDGDNGHCNGATKAAGSEDSAAVNGFDTAALLRFQPALRELESFSRRWNNRKMRPVKSGEMQQMLNAAKRCAEDAVDYWKQRGRGAHNLVHFEDDGCATLSPHKFRAQYALRILRRIERLLPASTRVEAAIRQRTESAQCDAMQRDSDALSLQREALQSHIAETETEMRALSECLQQCDETENVSKVRFINARIKAVETAKQQMGERWNDFRNMPFSELQLPLPETVDRLSVQWNLDGAQAFEEFVRENVRNFLEPELDAFKALIESVAVFGSEMQILDTVLIQSETQLVDLIDLPEAHNSDDNRRYFFGQMHHYSTEAFPHELGQLKKVRTLMNEEMHILKQLMRTNANKRRYLEELLAEGQSTIEASDRRMETMTIAVLRSITRLSQIIRQIAAMLETSKGFFS